MAEQFKGSTTTTSTEVELCHGRMFALLEEEFRRDVLLSCVLASIQSAQNMLCRIGLFHMHHQHFNQLCDLHHQLLESDFHDNLADELVSETASLCYTAGLLNARFKEYEEMQKKERTELESSILSLSEENRDMSGLLKIAIMEKEAMQKSKRSKGVVGDNNNNNRRAAILQIAEKGLQKVGFGFVMGVLSGDNNNPQADSTASCSSSSKSDTSDGEEEEEVDSLVVTVDNVMKNLRSEINDLRKSLAESRLNCEHLQSLSDGQAQKLKENELYIKDLEDRETQLSSSLEELTAEMKVAGEEIARWRKACELEVEAGKAAIKERDTQITQLNDELGRTKSALETLNNKLQLKERLASTAMAAQAAAETCLRLADSRSANLRERIEELTKEVEEAEGSNVRRERRGRALRRVRHVCWPWQGIRSTQTRFTDWGSFGKRRSSPEMEALLRLRI